MVAPTASQLPRTLGAVTAMGTLVGIMIGSGIFKVPSAVAGYVQSPTAFMMVWVVGGFLAVAGALMFAELAAMFPEAGGRYVYLREGVGLTPAFCYAWVSVVLLRPISLGARALVFAAYLGALVPSMAAYDRYVGAGLLIVLGAVNYRSVALSAGITVTTSIAKLAALIGIVVMILLAVPATAVPAEPVLEPSSLKGFLLALVTVMWTYSGWGSTTYITGEVRNAEKTMPRVLAGGVFAIVLLFLLVNWAYLQALPMSEMANSEAIAAAAAGRLLGPLGTQVMSVIVMVAVLGSLAGTMLASPRLPFALGRDVPRLASLSAVHKVFKTPHVAVLLTTAMAITLLWSSTFEQLAEFYILGGWPFYVLTAIGYFKLRRQRPDLPRPFRTPGYPLVPAFFLVAAAAMVINGLMADPLRALAGGLAILTGIPILYLLRRKAAD